jgi:hypothetical protein
MNAGSPAGRLPGTCTPSSKTVPPMSAIHAAISVRDPQRTGHREHAPAPGPAGNADAREQPQYPQLDEQPEQTGSAAPGLPVKNAHREQSQPAAGVGTPERGTGVGRSVITRIPPGP